MQQEIANAILFGNYVPKQTPSGYFIGWIEIDSCFRKSKSIWNRGEEYFKCYVSQSHLFEFPVKSETEASILAKGNSEQMPYAAFQPKLIHHVLFLHLCEAKFKTVQTSDTIRIELTPSLFKVLTDYGGRLKEIVAVKISCGILCRGFAVSNKSKIVIKEDAFGKTVLYRSCKSKYPVLREQALIVLGEEFSPSDLALLQDIL